MRPLTTSTLAYVLASASQSTYVFYLTPTFTRTFGLESLNPWAFSLAAVATMIASLPAGNWSDRAGRRPVMALGWGIVGVGPALLALAVPLEAWRAPALIVGSVVTGVGLGFGFVASQSYVSDLVTRERLGASFGYVSAAAVFGIALGPFIGAALFSIAGDAPSGLRLTAIALSAFAGASLVLTLLLPTARTAPPSGPIDAAASAPRLGGAASRTWSLALALPRHGREAWRRLAARDLVRGINGAFLVLGFAYGLVVPYFAPFFLGSLAADNAEVGVVFGAGTLAAGAAGLALAALVTRFGERCLLVAAALASTATLAGLAFASSMRAAAPLYVARYFAAGFIVPILNTLLIREAAHDERGRAMGASNVAWNAGWAVASAAGGLALATLGGLLFPLGGLLALGALLPLARSRSQEVL